MFLTELAEPTLLVIYPGRFQPFHNGHHAVYEYLTGKFGRNNVYIATSNKTDNLKSPFTFAEKAYFMQLTGVPADRIIQATQPYQIQNVLQSGHINVANPENTVVIFAVSEKDMAEDPRFSFAPKKDGSDPYFQPFKNIRDVENMNQHGYIMTVPTFDFTVAGEPMRSGTELRKLYASSNEQQRQVIVTDLFGRYTREAEQIMNTKIPAEQNQPEPVAETKADPKRTQLLAKARIAHPLAKSDEEALALYINDKEELDFGNVEDEEHSLERRVDDIEHQLQDLLYKTVNESAGVGVIANKKQAQDPRYSMSLTKDVRPGQINKSLRAFNLKEEDLDWVRSRLGEGAVDTLTARHIEYINQDIDAIKQRIATEQLPTNYVGKLKQQIAKLEQERAKLAFNPQ